MKKTMMNYEAPVAEMIEMQAVVGVMTGSGGTNPDPSDPTGETPDPIPSIID